MISSDGCIALVDCNNFYVSCERAFNPKLCGKPVIVLSNNDGCIVSRSEEAKRLGIGMGAPYFKCDEIIKNNSVNVFSSNYSLYADMSRRVMQILSENVSDIEIYSIDEAFLYFENYKLNDVSEFLRDLKNKIFQYTSIPVTVGIASTKTLAKTAAKFAKKNANVSGIADFLKMPEPNANEILKKIPIDDVWGVGAQYAKLLESRDIKNAYDFKCADREWIRKKMSVNGLRTLLELNGFPCISLETVNETKKNIMCSRSFGEYLSDFDDIKSAVALYASHAAEKLRAQHSVAWQVGVFITTNFFAEPEKKYYNSATISLDTPTAYTPDIASAAMMCLKKIFKRGYKYKKAGVLISEITSDKCIQPNLFDPQKYYTEKQMKLMETIDTINKKNKRDIIRISSFKTDNKWTMRRDKMSPRYTTNWNELPLAFA